MYHNIIRVRRKVFISYHQADQNDVNCFVDKFSNIFIPKTVGVQDGDFDVDSDDPIYIMRKIRETKLEDSTVTIVLIGNCTHSRRYVDWEIKASLQQGDDIPNGLIGINLSYIGEKNLAPDRLSLNWKPDDSKYARYYTYPTTTETLREWIEDAFLARTKRANLIENPNKMMKYNSTCKVHGINHGA